MFDNLLLVCWGLVEVRWIASFFASEWQQGLSQYCPHTKLFMPDIINFIYNKITFDILMDSYGSDLPCTADLSLK